MSEELQLIRRIINGFKHYGCFIFEKKEFELVKKVVKNSNIDKLLTVRKADPRYDHVYVLIPWELEFHQECESRIRKMLVEGGINRDLFKKNYPILLEQCVRFFERERIREIIRILEEYVKSMEIRVNGEERIGNEEISKR